MKILLTADHPMAEPIKSQTFELPGYYVIKLDQPVKIETESFDVAVRYSDAAGGETVGVPAASFTFTVAGA